MRADAVSCPSDLPASCSFGVTKPINSHHKHAAQEACHAAGVVLLSASMDIKYAYVSRRRVQISVRDLETLTNVLLSL